MIFDCPYYVTSCRKWHYLHMTEKFHSLHKQIKDVPTPILSTAFNASVNIWMLGSMALAWARPTTQDSIMLATIVSTQAGQYPVYVLWSKVAFYQLQLLIWQAIMLHLNFNLFWFSKKKLIPKQTKQFTNSKFFSAFLKCPG
jgi:hypothetical protein